MQVPVKIISQPSFLTIVYQNNENTQELLEHISFVFECQNGIHFVFEIHFMESSRFCNEILQVDRHYMTNLFRPLTEEGHHQCLKHLLLSAVPQFFNEGD